MNNYNSNIPSRTKGIFMFALLLFAYVVFATNWVSGSNLSKQITHYYFNGKSVSPMISEVVNYTITIARIVSNLLAAYILIKLNPRKAVIFALICLSFSFIAIFSPNYWLYTFARMIMAFGGSMIIVFINTFVAKFVSKDKRIITSALTTAAYNFGAALVAILFYIFKDTFIANWRYTMIGFSIISILLLIIWIFIAEDFKPTVTWKTPNYFVQKLYLESLENSNDVRKVKPYTYKDAFKDKFIYFFAFGFGGFLFLYVMPLVSLPNKVAEAVGGSFKPEFMILSVTLGGIVGTIVSMFFGKLHFRRKPFLISHGILMISAMFIGLQVVYYNSTLAYALFAIAGFFMYSQYPVYLNYPYELPDVSSQKLTIMFGVFWAFGYAIYTIFNFVWSIILQHYGYTASIAFYILASCSYIIFVFTFPETMKKIK